MNHGSPSFLKVEDLTVQYTSGGEIIHAVNGVSFSLERGKTLALVGETGAGKTTIARAILRILPDRAAYIAGGKVELEGTDLLQLSEKEMQKIRGRRISMVFQDPMTALNPIMRVGNQVAEVIKEHNAISRKEARERAMDILELVGIQSDRFYNYPHEFSGGMKQRVVIAMALACNPEVLLADEPTTALDVTIQAQVIAMIRDLREKFNTAMILITHDLGVVANVADEVAVIYAGNILEYAPQKVLHDNPRHPYTLALFNAIPTLEAETERLENIAGFPPDPTAPPPGCCFAPRCKYCTPECTASVPPAVELEPGHYCRCFHSDLTLKEVGHG